MNSEYFLTFEQLEKLDTIKRLGFRAPISDFGILTGGKVSNLFYYDGSKIINEKKNDLLQRTGVYWLKPDSLDVIDKEVGISFNGGRENSDLDERYLGIRMVVPPSQLPISDLKINQNEKGIKEFYYGYYPQISAPLERQRELNKKYEENTLLISDRTYVTDTRCPTFYHDIFMPTTLKEYIYSDGKKYVRVKANFYDEKTVLSNEETYHNGDMVWVEVLPVKWFVDLENDVAISEQILIAGIQFYNNYTNDLFYIDDFVRKHFLADIMQDTKFKMFAKKKTRLEKMNPDPTLEKEKSKMTDTEIIHNWIEAGSSVLLRGPSGIGKTERLTTLYPNLIYIKLTNNMFPEKIVGSINLQTGQNIPPDYAKEALLEYATLEEKKLIEENVQNLYDLADTIYERSKNSNEKLVILLDELLNVKPAVQTLVYTLVLNKLVETGRGLKLPYNTVVVATGNSKKHSKAAEDLAEALEKRFDHIYDMWPKVDEWISEYAIPNKVHPMVTGYILSKYLETGRSEAIKDINYFYEEPEVGEEHLDYNGCRGKTNDPRSWVSLSNTLYSFEKDLQLGKFVGKDVEDMLKKTILSKLREEWAIDFYNFYNTPSISLEEVINRTYTDIDLPQNLNESFCCVANLLLADESQVAICREFIEENCGSEYLKLYDLTYSANNQDRMRLIYGLQTLDKEKKARLECENPFIKEEKSKVKKLLYKSSKWFKI